MKPQTSSMMGRLMESLVMIMGVGVLFYGLYRIQGQVIGALQYWWEKVGVVMAGLLPLTAFLVGLVLYILFSGNRRAPWVHTGLSVVAQAAPMLGFLGTVLGVSEGAAKFTMAHGVEALLDVVTQLMQGVSVALLSTAWGTVLALPALVLIEVLFPRAAEEDQRAEADDVVTGDAEPAPDGTARGQGADDPHPAAPAAGAQGGRLRIPAEPSLGDATWQAAGTEAVES
jgi:hypothetical protein